MYRPHQKRINFISPDFLQILETSLPPSNEVMVLYCVLIIVMLLCYMNIFFFSGKSDKRKPAYRPYYGHVGDIRSLFGAGVPVVALTATATDETKAIIFKDLCLKNCTDVTRTPEKRNITYWLKDFSKGEICDHFEWLVAVLRKNRENTPRMIIFFSTNKAHFRGI